LLNGSEGIPLPLLKVELNYSQQKVKLTPLQHTGRFQIHHYYVKKICDHSDTNNSSQQNVVKQL